ncbi:MAG: NAD(P)/FAD-dependent oxidoreductase, partial [Kangiellaceae bacterium]
MSVVIDYDVIVIGAGPGGCSTAIRLAEFGFKVAIIERQAYPRSHVGICISDQTIALLEFLNISEQFYGANYWRRNLTAISWGEQEFHTFPQPGFHVNRGTLDQFLLDRAHAVGATVYQPAQVLKLSQKNCAYREAEVKFGPCNLKLRTHFIVDAAGRCQSIPGTQVRDSEPLVALCASWSLTQRPAVDGAIESGDDAWLWFARTSQDSAVVSIFCDPRSLRSEKKLILQDSYSKFLSQFLFLRSSSFGEQSSEVTICNASSYHSVNPVGDKHIRVGDACLSIDPLSSQGVHLALQSGIQAAVVVR